VVVLHDVLAVELRIFFGFEQVEMRLVVSRVCARRTLRPTFITVAGIWLARVADG
jgi:hypothetical protein